MSPRRWRWRELWAELCGLRRTLRGGPGHAGPRSDHFDGQRFFNPGGSTGRPFGDFVRWQRTRQVVPWPRWREIQPAAPLEPLQPGELALTFINHVTFLIRLPGLNVLTDPVFAQRASPLAWLGPQRVHAPGLHLASLPAIDVVFVSHNHYDHMDLGSLRELARRFGPLFVTGLGNAAFLQREGIAPVVELDWWERTCVRGVELLFTPAQHWSSRGPGRRNHTLWGGLWLRSAQHCVYFAADTGYARWFRVLRERLGSPDVALLPIGAYEPRWFMRDQHMNPDDAVRAHRELGAALSIGMHFGCFRLTDESIDEPVASLLRALEHHGVDRSKFFVLQPGQTVSRCADASRPQVEPAA